MFKPALIAALLLVPAIGFAAADTEGVKRPRAAHLSKADTDGNGQLSRTEVGQSLPRLARKFDQIDLNKDGQLSRDEMKAWKKTGKHAYRKKTGADRRARAVERFKHADTNGDGAISRDEAQQHTPRLAKKFDRIDSDKDGKLTPDELRAYREARRSRKDKA